MTKDVVGPIAFDLFGKPVDPELDRKAFEERLVARFAVALECELEDVAHYAAAAIKILDTDKRGAPLTRALIDELIDEILE